MEILAEILASSAWQQEAFFVSFESVSDSKIAVEQDLLTQAQFLLTRVKPIDTNR